MSNETGGPAFPTTWLVDQYGTKGECEGMTLRDYFAAMAMAAIIAKIPIQESAPPDWSRFEQTAGGAYYYADAMLRERDK
jgi:hypothetical protein